MFAACSMDGFIARSDGSIDWVAKWDPAEAGYYEFFESADGLVMGAKTYEQKLSLGEWR